MANISIHIFLQAQKSQRFELLFGGGLRRAKVADGDPCGMYNYFIPGN